MAALLKEENIKLLDSAVAAGGTITFRLVVIILDSKTLSTRKHNELMNSRPDTCPSQQSYTNDSIRALIEPQRVSRDVYTDKQIFALEMKRIWGQAWIYVGHESQIRSAGDYITTHIALTPVIMVRDANGEDIHVLINRCGHRGATVCEARNGTATNGLFKCPYHGWMFRADGSLRSYPSPGGYKDVDFDKDKPDFGMPRVKRVENYRGFIFASLAETGPDLKTFLGETQSDH